jgi:hypothetical protein
MLNERRKIQKGKGKGKGKENYFVQKPWLRKKTRS